jgi:hypothetical protein
MAFHYSPKIVTDGLIFYIDVANTKSYSTGTTLLDLTTNKYSSTLFNGVNFSSSNSGILVFDGVDDFVSGPTSSNFAFDLNDFSVSHWFYINSFTGSALTPTILDLRSVNTLSGGATGFAYSDYVLDNKFRLYWGTSDKYVSTTDIYEGYWYNITSVRLGLTLSVYINGLLDGFTTSTSNLNENGFRIGRNISTVNTSYLNGGVAIIKIYNRALTSTQVSQNFNTTKSRFGL